MNHASTLPLIGTVDRVDVRIGEPLRDEVQIRSTIDIDDRAIVVVRDRGADTHDRQAARPRRAESFDLVAQRGRLQHDAARVRSTEIAGRTRRIWLRDLVRAAREDGEQDQANHAAVECSGRAGSVRVQSRASRRARCHRAVTIRVTRGRF
ncbi:MAG TPA: hypothetical protein VGM39_08935 [Kofleriaceae bacterium]|jgi:hypothetical protein